MTLIEKPHSEAICARGDPSEPTFLRAFDSLLREVDMRRHTGGLLKLSRKMMH
jgi:hypothetical protein